MFYAHRVRRTACFLAAATAASSLAVAPAGIASQSVPKGRSCAHSNVPANRASARELRSAVVCLINQERRRWHLPPLRQNRKLDRAAQGHTNQMVEHGYFAHVTRGSTPGTRIAATGFRWSSVGENIAAGFPTALDAVQAWMASTGHCRNILDPSYHSLGVGESPRAISGASSRPATWTADFALAQSQGAPSHDTAPAAGCPY